MQSPHTFHIPVMGIGFTIDSPLKVAHYGIDSVISLVDDILIEKLRKMYTEKYGMHYQEITDKIDDFRAKRITAYLNLLSDLVNKKFETLKRLTKETEEGIYKYVGMLPEKSPIKASFKKLAQNGMLPADMKKWADAHLKMGSIDVNIMTKVDKENYIKDEKLSSEYNDAHAALRGFANSKLNSSVVLSAGLNPIFYSYIAQFDDFYPDENGLIKKKIILKVSDYRSAIIQGKFLAKKGLWVSEYRIESGLNCGGHAFATDGYLLGPVLAEFKEKREELKSEIQELVFKELANQNRMVPNNLSLKISAQGGVGTHEEHDFLISEYNLDSVGWGTPFLLVPEATTVDDETLIKLVEAKEEDLYLSNISPLGIPFNSLRNNTKDVEKQALINKGRPGSACPKKFVALNKEFKEKGICTASREYQHLKIKELKTKELTPNEYATAFEQIVEKSCTCVGLGTSALLTYNLDTKVEGKGVSICPGPNMAYFSKIMDLSNMIDHVYGRSNVITRTDRPNLFIKELQIYIDYLKNKLGKFKKISNKKEGKYLLTFSSNLNLGISYYKNQFQQSKHTFKEMKDVVLTELNKAEEVLNSINREIENLEISA
ncbi:hypothetical protein KO566_00100 [Flavobacteriaceae bacterium XHP0103]|uniref:hypothetical protein n=1 Tax=Marixanthotalea marina TaxID=2844359 RepID=UPI002989B3F0|nr:hypothetical protein [Marixanthotalea marina]MBU3820445.1 hypothetical protein [Marixanthotalea marina]